MGTSTTRQFQSRFLPAALTLAHRAFAAAAILALPAADILRVPVFLPLGLAVAWFPPEFPSNSLVSSASSVSIWSLIAAARRRLVADTFVIIVFVLLEAISVAQLVQNAKSEILHPEMIPGVS